MRFFTSAFRLVITMLSSISTSLFRLTYLHTTSVSFWVCVKIGYVREDGLTSDLVIDTDNRSLRTGAVTHQCRLDLRSADTMPSLVECEQTNEHRSQVPY